MSKRETKFNASWSEKYAWISKDKNYTFCQMYLSYKVLALRTLVSRT